MWDWIGNKSIAGLLSQNMSIGRLGLIFNSFNKLTIQMTSQVAVAIAMYYASAEDLDTMVCLLLFQEMGESPR